MDDKGLAYKASINGSFTEWIERSKLWPEKSDKGYYNPTFYAAFWWRLGCQVWEMWRKPTTMLCFFLLSFLSFCFWLWYIQFSIPFLPRYPEWNNSAKTVPEISNRSDTKNQQRYFPTFFNRFNLMLAGILQSHFFVKTMCEKETSRNSSIHISIYDDLKFGINVSKNKVFPLPYVLKINVPNLITMLGSRSLLPFFTVFHLHNNDPPIACSHNWAPHTCFTLLHVMVFCSFT